MGGFGVVVAADEARGIGRAGGLPWRLPGDMAFFKRITSEAQPGKRNAVIMGRKTYESILPKFRPLAGRLNVVLSRQALELPAGVEQAASFDAALALVNARDDIDHTFVIGGANVYAQALVHAACARVYLTRVHASFDCDAFLSEFEHGFELVRRDGPHQEAGLTYTFELYARPGTKERAA